MPEPIALGFDTSAAHCAAALLCRGRIVASRLDPMAKGQAERLFPLLEELLAEAGVDWHDLSVLGVGIGPGNFTGIRISVAAARGLALSLKVPAIGVSATEALAHGQRRPCRVIIPGRQDRVIWQDFTETPTQPAEGLLSDLPPGPPVLDHPTPIAEGIAHLAALRLGTDHPRPAPIYLRPADAAPPRDRGPAILT